MAISEGYKAVAAIIPIDLHRQIHEIAKAREISVSTMLSVWLRSGIDAPIERDHKIQSVRAYKDELMISLPRDWTRRSGVEKGDRVSVAYSDDALIVRR